MENPIKEPTLDQYGLNVSTYENYRDHKNNLEQIYTTFKSERNSKNHYSWLAGLVCMIGVIGFLAGLSSINDGNLGSSTIFAIVFIVGIFFGKASNAIEKEILEKKFETDKKIEEIKKVVYPFEEACVKYYLNTYDEFYSNNLYRKHKNTEKYSISSKSYRTILDEILVISQKLIFFHHSLANILSEHKNCLLDHLSSVGKMGQFFNSFDYINFQPELINKINNHQVKYSIHPVVNTSEIINANKEDVVIVKNSSNFKNDIQSKIIPIITYESKEHEEIIKKSRELIFTLNNPIKPVQESPNSIIDKESIVIRNTAYNGIDPKLVPPEKLYSIARKINWNELNKKRGLTGMQGEEIVLELERDHLKAIGREDLMVRVTHMSKIKGDGLGYDILSFFPDGNEKYIEVKSTSSSNGDTFYLSENELSFLRRNEHFAYVYKVFNVNESEVVPYLEAYEASYIINTAKIAPTQYIVKI